MRGNALALRNARINANRGARWIHQYNLRIARGKAQQKQLAEAFANATAELTCEILAASDGSQQLALDANFADARGRAFVLLRCNTQFPGTRRPVCAMLITPSGLEFLDLKGIAAEQIGSFGRVFLFPSNLASPSGAPVAALPAFADSSGNPRHVAFSSAGRVRGMTFVVGTNGLGSFLDPKLRSLLVARPTVHSGREAKWLWLGRSTESLAHRLRFPVLLLWEDKSTTVLLRSDRTHRDLSSIDCTPRDDAGDPFGIIDPRQIASPCILDVEGVPTLIARPNRRHPDGREIFMAPADARTGLIDIPYPKWERDDIVELGANHTEPDGSRWLVVSEIRHDGRGAKIAIAKLEAS